MVFKEIVLQTSEIGNVFLFSLIHNNIFVYKTVLILSFKDLEVRCATVSKIKELGFKYFLHDIKGSEDIIK